MCMRVLDDFDGASNIRLDLFCPDAAAVENVRVITSGDDALQQEEGRRSGR